MDIQVESDGNQRIVHIMGKITHEHCPALQQHLDAVFSEGARRIYLDLRHVPFIDSSGVGEMLRLYKKMKDAQGEVILLNPNEKVRELFTMYRFDRFIKIQEITGC